MLHIRVLGETMRYQLITTEIFPYLAPKQSATVLCDTRTEAQPCETYLKANS